MFVAVMSDAHDEPDHLHQAVRKALALDCRHLLFLGDLATVTTLRFLRTAWPYGMDIVPGNNDFPLSSFLNCTREWHNTTFHPSATDITLDHRRIFLTHIPGASLRLAAESGEFDAIFFGHTHRPEQHRFGSTLIANPGDIQGRFGAPSFGIYDTTHATWSTLPVS